MESAAAVSAQKPPRGFSRVIRPPIVRTMRQPPLKVPKAIAACAEKITQTGTFISKVSDSNSVIQSSSSSEPMDPRAVAEYSAEILTELRDLASGAGHTFLAYLIQVAVEEAKIQASDGEQR